MAYAVSEGGPPELYVAQYPDLSDRVRVSKGGGGAPHWRRDGRELFFRQGTTQGRFFVALISTTPALTASPPALLFYGPYDGIFDVTADGRQVLGIYRPPMSEQPHLTVLDLPRVSSQ